MTMPLTDLERHVLEQAAAGCTEKCISSRRRVSRNATARTLTRARRKLGANSTTQAVAHYERLKASEELAEFAGELEAIHERSGSLLERMRAKLPARRPGVATCGVLLLLAFVPGMVGHVPHPLPPTATEVPLASDAVAIPSDTPAALPPYWLSGIRASQGKIHSTDCRYHKLDSGDSQRQYYDTLREAQEAHPGCQQCRRCLGG